MIPAVKPSALLRWFGAVEPCPELSRPFSDLSADLFPVLRPGLRVRLQALPDCDEFAA